MNNFDCILSGNVKLCIINAPHNHVFLTQLLFQVVQRYGLCTKKHCSGNNFQCGLSALKEREVKAVLPSYTFR